MKHAHETHEIHETHETHETHVTHETRGIKHKHMCRACHKKQNSLDECLKWTLLTGAATYQQRIQTVSCAVEGLRGIITAVQLPVSLHHRPVLVPHLHIVVPSSVGGARAG